MNTQKIEKLMTERMEIIIALNHDKHKKYTYYTSPLERIKAVTKKEFKLDSKKIKIEKELNNLVNMNLGGNIL